MVVLFLATIKHKNSSYSNKEYAEHVKKGVLNEDANKCIGLDLSVLRDLQMSSSDGMLKQSDELLRIQHEIEGFLKTLEKKLFELQPDSFLSVNLKNKPHRIKDGILAFSWDEKKYPKTQKTVENLLERFLERLNIVKGNLKTKSDEYYGEVEKLKLKQKSDNDAKSFMKKDYREILKNKTDQMVISKYLTSLFVFDPNSNIELFKERYENLLKDCVIPSSALKLDNNEDDKLSLWRVVIMNHLKESYISELRKVVKANSKEYDEQEITILPSLLIEQKSIEASIEDQKAVQSYYSEIFYSVLHLMYLRLYTEANLKYGTGDYHCLLIIPEKEGEETKIVNLMLKKENDFEENLGWYGTKEDIKDSEDFFPFILIKLGVPLSLNKFYV